MINHYSGRTRGKVSGNGYPARVGSEDVMKEIAILGFGIVGGGIPTVLEENAEQIRRTVGEDVHIRYILDLREFPDSPLGDRVVHSIDPILADPEITLVCEAMGGLKPAYDFTAACLSAGKSVVTSNKELVSEKGAELLRLARENRCFYLFEGSVGGGIPLIRPFLTSFAGEKPREVSGIVNGTTNYILTAMLTGKSYDDALREAQELGYAERDPSADVDGIDAQRKIMILTGLCSGWLPAAEDVHAEGIRSMTRADMEGAIKTGGTLRLIARFVMTEKGASAGVCPMIVLNGNALASVNGVYNAVSLTLPSTGDILYYGRGAGRLPTAAALVSDLTAVLSGAAGAERMPVFEKMPAGTLVPFDSLPCDAYVRTGKPASEAEEILMTAADGAERLQGEGAEFIVKNASVSQIRRLLPDARIIRILR